MKTKTCKTCNHCNRLYRRIGCGFYWDKNYYCADRKELVDGNFGCLNWTRKKVEYVLNKQRFDQAENDIKLLSDYLKDL